MAMASCTSAGAGLVVSTTVPSTTTYWYGGSSRWTTSVTAPARSMSRALRLDVPVLIRMFPSGV